MSPKEPIDRALEEYLKNDSELSRAYKEAAGEKPPAALDAAILQEARRAVDHGGRVARGPFARTWLVPASLAAVLLLTVGLVTFVSRESGEAPSPAGAPRRALEADRLQSQQPRSKLEAQAPAAPLAEEPALMMQQKVPAEKKAAPAPPPAKMRTDAPASVTPAMVPAESTERRRARDEVGRKSKEDKREQRPPAALTATEIRALSPEEWLKRIAQLREQGKHDEAEASLAAFKKRYPDYPIEKFLK
ncbi:MAG: hypothetical protein V3R62_10480 [Acidiferrobacterales bacterium]